MNDNNYLSPFCVNCIKISIILFLARFFTVYDVFVTNHFVNTLFDVAQYTMLLVLIIANPEIAIMREKLKNTILVITFLSILINIVYLSLYVTYKTGYGSSEDYYVSISEYHMKNTFRKKIEIKFNEQNVKIHSDKLTMDILVHKYGENFQDSVQMHLRVRKVLSDVYGVESYEILKKTP